ncbi:hypothetical protein ACF0H5_014468 [Mactra antiquata]
MEPFTQVKTSKRQKRKQRVKENSHFSVKTIQDIRFDLRETKFYQDTLGCVKKIINEISETDCTVEIVCYGLGNFIESYIARYQLALLVALRENLKESTCIDCDIYDPVFTEEECQILDELEFNVLKQNQEAKHRIKDNAVTLFYMPHCGKALYNNVLWSNWGLQLRNAVIIGNSFSRMIECTPSRILEKTAMYIIKIEQYTEEVSWQVPDDYQDIFNDTSIHTFISLDTVKDDVWNNSPEPVYDNDEAEIILKK